MNREKLEQLFEEGRYQEAWWAYTALTARGEVPADVHIRGAQAAHALGHLHSALYAIDQALPTATGEDEGRVRFTRAVLLMGVGRCAEALEENQRWIADLSRYPSLEARFLGVTLYNMGVALRQLQRYTEAVERYRAACEHLRAHGRRDHLCLALQNMAWAACLSGDEATAGEALDGAEPLCEGPESHWHQQIGRAFLQAVSRQGDLHNVMTRCQHIIEHKGDDLPLAVRSHAYWLAGRVALELNLGETARIMAEQALWFAAAVGDDRCIADAAALINEIDQRLATTA